MKICPSLLAAALTGLSAALIAGPPRLRIEGETAVLAALSAVGSLNDAGNPLAWPIEAPRAGSYEVDLNYICEEKAGGVLIEVACGASVVRGRLTTEGQVTLPLGILEIPAGESLVVVRPVEKPGTIHIRALMLERGFSPLFDGKSLAGWQGATKGYAAENGTLVCLPKGGGNLFTEKEYSDFAFRFEFKLEPGSNNGLGIRAPLKGDAAYAGMEIQILDDEKYKGQIQPWQAHGSIYDVVPAKQGHLRKTGEWNVEEVIARGPKVKVVLNGTTIVDADLGEVKDEQKLKKHPGLLRKKGHLGFLGHGTRVEFRNIRIKDLSEPPAVGAR